MKYSTDPNSAVNEYSTVPSSLISQCEPTGSSSYAVWLRSGKPTAQSALWVIQRLPSPLHRFCSKSVPSFWRLALSQLFKDTNTLQWQLQCTCCLNQMITKHRKYLFSDAKLLQKDSSLLWMPCPPFNSRKRQTVLGTLGYCIKVTCGLHHASKEKERKKRLNCCFYFWLLFYSPENADLACCSNLSLWRPPQKKRKWSRQCLPAVSTKIFSGTLGLVHQKQLKKMLLRLTLDQYICTPPGGWVHDQGCQYV